MKKWWRVLLSLLVCLLLGCSTVYAASEAELAAAASTAEMVGAKSGELLAQEELFPAGSAVSDWTATAFALAGVEEAYGDYLASLEQYVTEKYQQNGCLDTLIATEYHRITLTVLALGGDPTAFGTDEEGNAVNLIADGTYDFAGELGKQGLNGWIYALIALDSGAYSVPEDARYTREDMREAILNAQEADGGFGLAAGSSDVDITAMALQALAPYQEECVEAVEAALSYLAGQMTEECGFVSYGEESAESVSQVILALCALGMDPEQELRFCSDGKTLLQGLSRFALENGMYCHSLQDMEADMMSTEQALLAQKAVERLRSGGAWLYDFTDYEPPVQVQTQGLKLWPFLIGGAAVLVAVAGILWNRKRRTHGTTDGCNS